MSDEMIQCKACKTYLQRKSLVRHLVQPQKKQCRSVYGEEFIDNWKRQSTIESKKKYKEKTKEDIKNLKSEYSLHYYEKNKEKYKERYENNKAKIKENRKRRYQEQLDKSGKARPNHPRRTKKGVIYFAKMDKNFVFKKRADQYLLKGVEKLEKKSNGNRTKFNELNDFIQQNYEKIEKELELIAEKDEDKNLDDVINLYEEVNIEWQWHVVNIQIDISMKKIADEVGQSYKYMLKCSGEMKCSKCQSADEPHVDSISSIMRKNKDFISKIEKEIADLKESSAEYEDEDDDPETVQKNDLKKTKVYRNSMYHKESQRHFTRGIEQFKNKKTEELILQFTEFQKVIDDTHTKIEDEIDQIAQKADENSVADMKRMYDEVNIFEQYHDLQLQLDISLKKTADKIGQTYRYFFNCISGFLCPKCRSAKKSQVDIESTSSIMKENKNYIRKRKPMNLTVADLDKSLDEDDEFKANVGPIEKRTMPRRKTEKEMVMEDLKYLEESDTEFDDLSKKDSEESESDSDDSVTENSGKSESESEQDLI